jgi:hypothetical protein
MLKILDQYPDLCTESVQIPCHGFGKIKKNILAYNNAAKYGYFFVVTDLDKDKYECAPILINEWLPSRQNSQLIFRVAVREVESWLLADKKNFASFFSVSPDLIPLSPDIIPDPKQLVISLARKSRKQSIKEAIIPLDKYASIGPGYNHEFCDFINNHWNIASARRHSPSLEKAIRAFERVIKQDISSIPGPP